MTVLASAQLCSSGMWLQCLPRAVLSLLLLPPPLSAVLWAGTSSSVLQAAGKGGKMPLSAGSAAQLGEGSTAGETSPAREWQA